MTAKACQLEDLITKDCDSFQQTDIYHLRLSARFSKPQRYIFTRKTPDSIITAKNHIHFYQTSKTSRNITI